MTVADKIKAKAREQFMATLKAGNVGTIQSEPLVASKGWIVDVKKEGIDTVRRALDGDATPIDVRDAAIAAIEADGAKGVVASFGYSDATVDSYSDTIAPDGWKFADFNRNPVALFAHDQWSPPIGKDVGVHIVPGVALKGIIAFTPPDLYDFGDMIGRMVKWGALNATSVGFAPKKYAFNEDRKGTWGPGIDYTEQELREISVVPVPANPNALVDGRAMKDAGIDTRPLIEWATKQLDGAGHLVLPRDIVERIARLDGRAPVTVGPTKSDEALPVVDLPAADPVVETPAPVEAKADGELCCPSCSHVGPASSFKPPVVDEAAKAASAIPTETLLAALKLRGVSVTAVDSESAPRQDDAMNLAERAGKLAAAEVARQLMLRTGRLP